MPEVSSDPGLTQKERETTITFDADPDRPRATVHSEHPSVIRWLLRHPDYAERERRVIDGAQVATVGTLPIGAVKLSGRRKSDTPGSVLGLVPERDSDA